MREVKETYSVSRLSSSMSEYHKEYAEYIKDYSKNVYDVFKVSKEDRELRVAMEEVGLEDLID